MVLAFEPGHTLSLDTAAIREIVLNPVPRRVWRPIAVSLLASEARRRTMSQTSARDMALPDASRERNTADLSWHRQADVDVGRRSGVLPH